MSKKFIAIASAVVVGLIVADTFAHYKNKRIAKDLVQKAEDLGKRIQKVIDSKHFGHSNLHLICGNTALISRRLAVQASHSNYSNWIANVNGLAMLIDDLEPIIAAAEADIAAQG